MKLNRCVLRFYVQNCFQVNSTIGKSSLISMMNFNGRYFSKALTKKSTEPEKEKGQSFF